MFNTRMCTAIVGLAVMLFGGVAAGADPEIPKETMTADTNSDRYGAAWKAIDGETDTSWRAGFDFQNSGAWLRIEFEGRYSVSQFDFLPYTAADDRITQYEIYVTDDPSTNKADWGSADGSATIGSRTMRSTSPTQSPTTG